MAPGLWFGSETTWCSPEQTNEIGRRLGRRRQAKEEAGARAGLGQVEGAVFALMGFLVAFTFSGAASPVISQASLGTVTGLVAKPSPEREPGAFCWS